MARKPLSSYNPLFYRASVWLRRCMRRLRWRFGGQRFARTREAAPLPFRVYRHKSLLLRRLGGVDMRLQHNKVTNLRIATSHLNGILIRPGETFSYARLVGKPTKRKGYLEGMLLSNGEAVSGIGGGVCQIANLMHWLCLHSPLTVTERHHHSFDVFPDSGRVVPFGSGATLFYNYRDYQVRNDTPYTFQLLIWVDDDYLNGDLRVAEALDCAYHVYEKNHAFIKVGDEYYRVNELWRTKVRKRDGITLENRLLQKNRSLVKYVPDQYEEFVPQPQIMTEEFYGSI